MMGRPQYKAISHIIIDSQTTSDIHRIASIDLELLLQNLINYFKEDNSEFDETIFRNYFKKVYENRNHSKE